MPRKPQPEYLRNQQRAREAASTEISHASKSVSTGTDISRREDLDGGLVPVVEQEAQPEIEFAGLEGPFFPKPSWRVSGLGAQCVDRKEVVPADRQSGKRQRVQLDLSAPEALVALEALLLLPEHDQQVAPEGVAARVLEGLAKLGVARVTYNTSFALVDPPLLRAQVGLYVGI